MKDFIAWTRATPKQSDGTGLGLSIVKHGVGLPWRNTEDGQRDRQRNRDYDDLPEKTERQFEEQKKILTQLKQRQYLFWLVAICAFITVAGFFLTGKILTGAAAVAEFLFITGGADTIPTVAAVIGRSTGVGKSIVFRFFFHYDSPLLKLPFVSFTVTC